MTHDEETEKRVKQVRDLFQEKVRGVSQPYFDECSIHARILIGKIRAGENPDINEGWPEAGSHSK